MSRLTPAQIVAAWEAGQPLDVRQRALLLLQQASGVDVAALQLLPEREIASRLVALRAATFGPTLNARVTCAGCGADLELPIECDLIAPAPPLEIIASCEECGGQSSCALDIREFVWREVDAAAERVLDDVHVIAAAYGWSEASILAMSRSRRHAYLTRLDAASAVDERAQDVHAPADTSTPSIAAVTAPPIAPGAATATPPHAHALQQNERAPVTVALPAPSAQRIVPRLNTRWTPSTAASRIAPAAPASTAAAERHVHVSIARLDIQGAVEDRREPAQPTRRQPSLGLAEYLQQREERAQ